MSESSSDQRSLADALINREIVRLTLLVLLAVVAFFLTREMAASNRAMSLRDAADAFDRGVQAMNAGQVDAATNFFRRAAVRNRSDKRYVLALARALAKRGDVDEAHTSLVALRETAPEDPDINVELARLAVARGDTAEATRFYRSALYAPWPADQAEARRQVRLELIRMLLDHQQSNSAVAELMALSANLPDDVPHHLQAGALFRRAGDQAHALDEYRQALRLDPENADALTGAGLSAFGLGNYASASRYLGRAPEGDAEVAHARALTGLVLSSDPLAARLGPTERGRRMATGFAHARDRLNACVPSDPAHPPAADAQGLLTEVRAFEHQMARPASLSQDEIEIGFDLVQRVEQYLVAHCGPATPLDEALILIGRQHGAGAP
jgi:Flp pilus assembly protein TadD